MKAPASTIRQKQEKVCRLHRLKRNKTIIGRIMYIENPKEYTNNIKIYKFNWAQNPYIKINFIFIYHKIFKINIFKSIYPTKILYT